MKHLPLLLVFAVATASAQTPTSIEAVEWDPAGRWIVTNGSNILQTSDGGDTWTVFGNVGATHGMEVVDGHLFALDNGVLRAVDLASEGQTSSLTLPGTSFLNGMGSRSGELIISDFGTGALHRVDISDPAAMSSSVFVSDLGATPNGVVIDEANNRALVVTWGVCKVYAVDLETAAVTTVAASTGLSNCDGIDLDGSGRAYVSSWSPNRITRFSPDFSTSEAVVTSGLSSPADISYALESDVLAVANSGSDLVTFHPFAESGVAEVERVGRFLPYSTGVWADAAAGLWNVFGLDGAGRLMWETNVMLNAGHHPVELAGFAGGRWEGTRVLVFSGPNNERTAIQLLPR